MLCEHSSAVSLSVADDSRHRRDWHMRAPVSHCQMCLFEQAPAKCHHPSLSFHLPCLLILLPAVDDVLVAWNVWIMSCNAHAVREPAWLNEGGFARVRVASISLFAREGFTLIDRYRGALCPKHTDRVNNCHGSAVTAVKQARLTSICRSDLHACHGGMNSIAVTVSAHPL